ncbi:TonB-dependent receptor [Tamlana sp. 2201CG12-4]|uniref:SusC/RagA family TonB-linked outer membrane protein n=1 Tax=Tamlana sp. 2201CG12-4 TaxID=3112582 RepID=UPI002DBA5560|nr:TonB-dependent receptor [Tamlana sp. 2201CG12-4]MEC3907028.1 TonB-dependent receptor [Tamlana sp. 2201CG12-4]
MRKVELNKEKNLLRLVVMLFFLNATAQNVVTGTVTSATDQMGLPGVTILIKGTSNGSSTDFDGNFSIDVPNNATLVFSYLGYITQEVPVSGKPVINISLEEDVSTLDEVVLIGYGSSLKKDLTSSVSVVDVGDVRKIQAPQIEQTLGGKIAGVNISAVNSEPGAGLKITIRGGNSINGNNAPLLVVDGVLGGDFQSLNANDIESMQVLKDASATAIYGSRGANGVIIVSTKSGKTGAIKVDLFTSSGFQRVRKKLDVFDASEHALFLTESDGFDFPDDIDNVDNPILSGKGTDWQDEIMQNGLYQNYHMNVAGGSEKLRAFLSLDYLNQEGVIINSDYGRFTGRLNLDYQVSDKFKISNNLSAYRTSTNRVRTNTGFGSGGGPISTAALRFSPLVPVYAEDGSYNGPLNSSTVLDNPVLIANGFTDLYETNFLQNTFSTEWEIIKGLKHNFSAAYTSSILDNKRYASKELLRALNVGEGSISNRKRDAWQLRNTLTYSKLFNDTHNVTILGGYEISKNTTFSSGFTARGFATEALTFNNIGIASEVTNINSDKREDGLVSYLARATYGYKSKYLFSVSGRADGSTKFAKNNKWASFTSGSVAWVASNESFLENSNTVSYLKLRASYGQSGSQAINPYQSLARYRTGLIYSNGGGDLINGALINRVANPDLKWETTTQYDIGFDLELFNSKLAITYDYFNKRTDDLLFNKNLLAITGIRSQIQNIGKLENKGHEFSIEAQISDKKLKWNASANISFLKNKVLNLGGDDNIFIRPPSSSRGPGFTSAAVLSVGEAVGNFFGYVADGIFKTQEDLDAINQPGAQLGSVRYKDTDNNGVIDDNDRKIIGNGLPDYIFGMTQNVSYKNFDLNIAVQGAQGNDVIWLDKRAINTTDRLNAWSPSNPDSNIPRNGDWGSDTNSNYVEDASYLKFNNISLGYTLPEQTVDKLGLKNMRIYVSAVDAFVITNYSGYDPEVNSHDENGTFNRNVALGFDSGSFPGVAQFLIGLNVSF